MGLASQDSIFSRVSGSLSATRPPQTRAAKARKMGMILVTPMKAAKMKLAMMAASLLMPLRTPNAVPLQSSEGRERQFDLKHIIEYNDAFFLFAVC